ncbi:MAG: hypothetical protein WCF18_04165 [Chthoniobacteraceae bacterium]
MYRLPSAPLLALLLLAARVHGGFTPPELAPVDRLIKSTQAYLVSHPAEADAHFTLGRIHYLAFARGAETIPIVKEAGDGGKPSVASDWAISFELYEARKQRADELALQDIGERGPRPSAEKASAYEEARGKRARQLEEQDWHPRGNLADSTMIAHAAAALAAFREASRLEPKNGAYALAVAALNEQFARWAAGQKPANLPPDLRALNIAVARDTYLHAFRFAIASDLALGTMPTGGPASLVSHEAGNAFIRLADHDRAKLKAPEKAAVLEVKAGLKKLKRLRVGAIPPL